MFAYSPGLVAVGAWHEILVAAVTAIVGVVALAAAVEGWLFGPAPGWGIGIEYADSYSTTERKSAKSS